jgi:hypothetical protein
MFLFRFLTCYINLPESKTIYTLDLFLVNHILGI